MKSSRAPHGSVMCPKCGKAFTPEVSEWPAPAADAETYALSEPEQVAVGSAPPADTVPVPMKSPVLSEPEKPALVPKKKGKKKKKKSGFASLDPDTRQLILYAGGAAMALLTLGGLWFFLWGKPLTLVDVAGHYTNDKEPEHYQIDVRVDGGCGLILKEPNAHISLVYLVTLEGANLDLKTYREVKKDDENSRSRQFRASGPRVEDLQRDEFGRLSFSGDHLYSSKLGRFSRVQRRIAAPGADHQAATPRGEAAEPVDFKPLGLDGPIDVSRDGSTAAFGTSVVDLATMKPVGSWDARMVVHRAAVSPDGRKLVLGGGSIRFMDARTGAYLTGPVPFVDSLEFLVGRQHWTSFKFTPDGKAVLGSDGFTCTVIDAGTGEQRARFEVGSRDSSILRSLNHLVMTADGANCITLALNYGPMRFRDKDPMFLDWWNLSNGEKIKSVALPPCDADIHALALSNDGKTLARLGSDRERSRTFIELRSASSGEPLREFPIESVNFPATMIYGRDDKSLIVNADAWKIRGELTEWDIATGRLTRYVAQEKPRLAYQLEQPTQRAVVRIHRMNSNVAPVGPMGFVIEEIGKLPWKGPDDRGDDDAKRGEREPTETAPLAANNRPGR